ncbi:MAG TPA: hypothetical protein PKD54_13045 [Pirellulaceae bacterium]|nr:hypothetical protein [Pirellulaceae bacterium]
MATQARLRQHATIAILVTSLSVALGCQPSDARKLAGVWELAELASLAERVNQSDSLPDDDLGGEAPAFAGNTMIVHFIAGGTLTTRTQLGSIERDKTGTWSVLANQTQEQPTRVAFSLAGESGELAIEWIDNDTIKMVPPNLLGLSMKLTFRRR